MRSVLPMKIPLHVAKSEGFDLYGNPQYGKARKTRCAVLRLRKSVEDTTVRADSSATRGHGQEILSDAWLLVSHREKIGLTDKLQVQGYTLKIVAIRPRYTVFGEHDHNEIEANIEHG